MRFTPRQAASLLLLANHRRKQDAAIDLSLNALAAQGDAKTINKRIKELTR